MANSSTLQKAQELIQLVKGKPLYNEQRKEKAIELAALILKEANRIQTRKEKKLQHQLARMMDDPIGKVFTTIVTDQCFRSNSPSRIADQLVYTIKKWGVPQFLDPSKKMGLKIFQLFGKAMPGLFVPLVRHLLRKETEKVILPGEPDKLREHMRKRYREGVRINLNHLGEAILGEEEAKNRLRIYLEDLSKPEVEYISIKISTICSQLNLLAWEQTLEILSERLRKLFRAAMQKPFIKPDGTAVKKFVNLDMEEYRDLDLTVELFCKVLDEPEFVKHSAGIVLQSYLPDSHNIQKQLTEWAMKRVANGGAPIKIRIVKGANLAMEQVEASLRDWPQAPYPVKADVDANYKLMVSYGCQKEHAKAANLGIASHNLFDIAYALLLRSEQEVESYACFEMLEGMADHMRRVIQTLSGDMLLYCPAATQEEFQNAVAYLVRRLDENTAPENFLRQAFGLTPETPQWKQQNDFFSTACDNQHAVPLTPRKTQDRNKTPCKPTHDEHFENEADTDWSLPQNRKWGKQILQKWSKQPPQAIPLVIGGKEITTAQKKEGIDPSFPNKPLFTYCLLNEKLAENVVSSAKETEKKWSHTSVSERSQLLAEIAQKMRVHRSDLIGTMVANTGKTVYEADVEISEAIDFAEYYRRTMEAFSTLEDIHWKPKGTILVAPPWNFPCSIPAGGILAALVTGNCVIFKPAPESILVGWQLANIFWEAGVGKDVLQFIACEDDPIGSQLIKDDRINAVILTGATATAKLLLKLRPGLDLIAETGGKNAMIISSLSDRDLAIKDLVQSAFGHAGQKCSACSLAVLEAEVYDDPHFKQQLKDAAQSLFVGSPWNPQTRLNPLIRKPSDALLKGLTSLEEGEEWLLEPKQDPQNPLLWSPGIKWGVKPNSFTHQNELFGPVLAVMRAGNLDEAIAIANGTQYGLTSGLHSLDEREQNIWAKKIEAGNCYINRGITGAIVQRQPFGGCKQSSFGKGMKAGGPNYITQMMHAEQFLAPLEQDLIPENLRSFPKEMTKQNFGEAQIRLWRSSVGSYSFYWNHYFNKDHDPSQLQGQDNILRYLPQKNTLYRMHENDHPSELFRIIAAATTCHAPLKISGSPEKLKDLSNFKCFEELSNISFVEEDEEEFIERVKKEKPHRIRLLQPASKQIQEALAEVGCSVIVEPILANGRLELLNFLREMSLSIDYHRYGNLGSRENEVRKPLISAATDRKSTCGNCNCYETS